MPRGAWWLVLAPLGFVAAGFAWPMATVLAPAFPPSSWPTAVSEPVVRALRIATEQALWSTLVALALALPLAWLHHTGRPAAGRLQLAMHAAPFVMPVFVVVFGLQMVLGPRGWSSDLLGWDVLGWLGPFATVVAAHAYYNYGFAARAIEAALRRRPRTLEAAARTLGASPAAAFLRTSLPLLWPSVGATALLVFLFCFGSFGVVQLMGAGRVVTLETEIYLADPFFTDPARRAWLGLLLLAVNALVLGLYLLLRRRLTRLPAEPAAPPRRLGLGGNALSWALAAAAFLPLLAVLVGGLRYAPVVFDGDAIVRRPETWSLAPWQALLHALPACAGPASPASACGDPLPADFQLGDALRLSLTYAAGSTLLALALAAMLAYGARHLRLLRKPTEALASLPVAGSGVLLGVAYSRTFASGGLLDLDGTMWIVLLAHTMLVFPFVARLVLPAFDARDPRLDDAARLAGASTWGVAARVHWPTLRPIVLAAASLAFALSLGDYGASTVLQDTDTRGITVWIGHLDGGFNPLQHASAVALAGLLCALTLAAYVVVERLGDRRGGVA